MLWSDERPPQTVLDIREGFKEEVASQGAPASSATGNSIADRGNNMNVGWRMNLCMVCSSVLQHQNLAGAAGRCDWKVE